MPKHVSTTKELRAMSAAELRKDIAELTGAVAKKRFAVGSGAEKDTASYARSKKQLARMLTVQNQTERAALNKKPQSATMPAPASAKATAGRPTLAA